MRELKGKKGVRSDLIAWCADKGNLVDGSSFEKMRWIRVFPRLKYLSKFLSCWYTLATRFVIRLRQFPQIHPARPLAPKPKLRHNGSHAVKS
jgi:hypothetical protein